MNRVEPTLIQLADGVHLASMPVRHLGLQLTATMAVLRVGPRKLLLYSPIRMTDELHTAITALGAVAHLYAPNLYHHLFIGQWSQAFPSARLHAPPGLAQKRPDLRIDRLHTSPPEPDFADVIDELNIDGFRLQESVLFYRPARTLVVADLVHNLGRPQHAWTAFYARSMGFYDRVALSRMLRWIAFSDRAAARRSIDTVLAQPIARMVVGHGSPLGIEARESLRAAYTWLPAERS